MGGLVGSSGRGRNAPCATPEAPLTRKSGSSPSPSTKDVLREAEVIKEALSAIGWQYCYGGPYPDAPKMIFMNGAGDLEVRVLRRSQNHD